MTSCVRICGLTGAFVVISFTLVGRCCRLAFSKTLATSDAELVYS